jgi:hypothetical protein
MSGIPRSLSGGALAGLGVAALVVGSGPLANLGREYRDGSVETYLLFGVPPALLGLGALIGGLFLVRSSLASAGARASVNVLMAAAVAAVVAVGGLTAAY